MYLKFNDNGIHILPNSLPGHVHDWRHVAARADLENFKFIFYFDWYKAPIKGQLMFSVLLCFLTGVRKFWRNGNFIYNLTGLRLVAVVLRASVAHCICRYVRLASYALETKLHLKVPKIILNLSGLFKFKV